MPPNTQPISTQSAKKSRLPDFDRDGPPSSQELILRYFEEDPNNIKHFYHGTLGKSTIVMAGVISRYIADNGGAYERTADSIHLKVNAWKRQWIDAKDFLNQTGAGGGARRLADAEEIGEDEYNKALREVEGDVLLKCPLWERLDPIFHESQGGDPSLYGDSTQDTNPTLNALENILEPTSDTPNQQSNRSTASVPVTPTPGGLSTRVRSGSRAVVKATSWNNFGDDSQSDISSISSGRRQQGAIERMLEDEEEFRELKKTRLEKNDQYQKELNEATKAEKIFNMADTTKRNNPELSWDECIERAESYMDRRVQRNRREGTS
ncbi:hypothetical protein L486_00002 [Kwoniella mangroviensis CBS 10435]|uniref:Uncharacterized protein n=1 Tax=Kwoniella mangroviensis CBS 10435 TaxID=1331196 RepID=A0A1B9IXW7_9TREE|nr:hypothetical protein L486_00002 [Kwoniella mangroviensis CBS 10435]